MSQSIWPKVPPRFVAAMLAGHSALGLVFAALIYIICLTGTILVLAHEIGRWENPQATIITSPAPATIVQALGNGAARAQETGIDGYVVVTTSSDGTPNLIVRMADFETGQEEIWSADAQGELVRQRFDGPEHFLKHLHLYLHLPETIGLLIVGLIGIALLSSIWSGVLSHPRIFRDAFRFRRGGSKRLEEADLHNRLSVWGLPFHIIVSLTGAILGLSIAILGILALAAFDGDMEKARGIVSAPTPEVNQTLAPLPDVLPVVESLLAKYPGDGVARLGIRYPGTVGQYIQIDLDKPNDLTVTDRYTFSADGELLGSRGFSDGALGAQIIGSLGPLHFGWFGSGWAAGFLKIAYVLLGLALTFITASGVTIWVARREAQGKPVKGWHRAWIACVWGQPLSYALVGIAYLIMPTLPAVQIWVAVTVLSFAPAFLMSTPIKGAKVLRSLTAASLVFLVIIHVLLNNQIIDNMAWVIDTVLLGCAAIIAATVVKGDLTHLNRPGTKQRSNE
ncbi:PepSY-associated TM helix domain-containing protein [Litorimonas haliclonae]|uniref:PepSY-associated TM helix domain-containing protein n=1 Tax=Litorimonas haliclonae TaxID=2081977 RepID=UPI0039EFCB2F